MRVIGAVLLLVLEAQNRGSVLRTLPPLGPRFGWSLDPARCGAGSVQFDVTGSF